MAIRQTKVDDILKRVNLLSETIAWVKTFDSATKNDVLNWIKEDQLRNKGVNKFGEVIGYYKFATEVISLGRKRAGEPYDLYDSGDFYRSMFVTVTGESIVIDANSLSFSQMKTQRWYSDSILGLTDENFDKLKRVVQRSYIKYAKEVLQII